MNYLKLIILIIFGYSHASFASFFDQTERYRGFYWFETKEQPEKHIKEKEYKMPTPEEATTYIETIKKRLDEARSQMIAVNFDPTAPLEAKRQAVITYKRLELGMWDGAMSMADSSEMANFTNPELADNYQQPTNVFGVKLKRQIDSEKDALKIMEFAGEFDLLLFTSDSCPYCMEFAPVLQRFVNEYHFQLDTTTLDGEVGGIAMSLGIRVTPTLVAVKKDGSQAFEISRGMISSSELEANILLAKKYSEELTGKKKMRSLK